MEKKGHQRLSNERTSQSEDYETTRTSNRPSRQRRRTCEGLVSVGVEMMAEWTWEMGNDHRLKRRVRREG
jgi:hypothetical protein